jgi:hypothetical protein
MHSARNTTKHTGPLRRIIGLAALVSTPALGAAQQTPMLEWASFFEGLSVYPDSRSVTFYTANGAFIPKAVYLGDGGGTVRATNQAYVTLRRVGVDTPIARWPQLVEGSDPVFCSVRALRPEGSPAFDQPGDYTLTFEIDDQRYTELPFSVQLVSNDDPFDPVTRMYIDGPWRDLACLRLGKPGQPDGYVELYALYRGGRFNTSGQVERLKVEVLHEGVITFVSPEYVLRPEEHESGWRAFESQLRFPDSQGGHVIREEDLLKKDGAYDIRIVRNGATERAFRAEVRGGKLVPHPRQNLKYEPRGAALLPRSVGKGNDGGWDLFWLDALDAEAARAAAATKPTSAAGPAAADFARWSTERPLPKRAQKTVVTSFAARADATIAVGDDVIAYGTGPNTGVAFLRVGEDKEETFPGSGDCSSKILGVCGKKLVLARQAQVLVYDTATKTLHEVPLAEVTLARTFASAYGAWPLATDGMLVVTLNDPQQVQDRRIVKVIDVSGPTPVVVALGNPDIAPKDLGGVAVDAETGTVVIGAQKASALLFGAVASNAVLQTFDLSSHGGVSNQCQPLIDAGHAVYFDAASPPRLRRAQLASGAVSGVGLLSKTARHYAVRGALVAHATESGRGSNMTVALVTGAGVPVLPVAAGGPTGQGLSVAIGADGRVYIAGNGDGGIGSGELLEVSDGAAWASVAGADGAPLAACDVAAGGHVVAFKTGRAQDVRVGYVLLGAQ